MSPAYEELFRQALRIRMVEEKITELYPSDKIQSPVHLSIGQEPHITAFIRQLDIGDQVFTSYRSHAVYLAKGGNLKKMLAELYGKASGISGGKAGSMHLCAPETNMMGSSAIVAATFSHALGAAYAFKLQRKKNIVASITGDGSTEEGVFHECLNFASLKKLPLLFLIENNGLAIYARIKTRQAFDLKKLAGAYNIPYFNSDNGFDMESVALKSREVAARIRRTGAPALFEIQTHRFKEHVGVNENHKKAYATAAETKKWRSWDPLLQNKALVKKYRPAIEKEIAAAVEYAENAPFPACEELLKDVY
jgi:pyruvate dehydrogenase E1 component alpha subunit